ncbi:MAG TPA: glycosyltransferase family 9 protein [Burkholderiales bacterium]
MTSARALNRIRTLGRAALSAARPRPRTRPENPRRILVLHELLLGDTVMLAPLLARLRKRYPQAEIWVTVKPAILPLFSGRPYGVTALAFDERAPGALQGLQAARDCDLAIVPGENRYTVTARALGARWVAALAGGRPGWKNWGADELVEFPRQPTSLGEIFASLASSDLLRYRPGDWPAPAHKPFALPRAPYAVLHVGASTPLKYWPAENWRALAERLSARYTVVWSCGPGESHLIPPGAAPAFPGNLDLPQVWHLLANASLLVAPDSGIANMAKLTWTRTVCLFGPSSAVLTGRGEFWKDAPFTEVTVADFACRDQPLLFGRDILWVRTCRRTLAECPRPRCMEAIALDDVWRALDDPA